MSNYNQRTIQAPIFVSDGHVDSLAVGGVELLRTQIIPVSLDSSVEELVKAYINIDIDIPLSMMEQNIESTCYIAIDCTIDYWVSYTDGVYDYRGKWKLDYDPAFFPLDPNGPYPQGRRDPSLKKYITLTPSSGSNFLTITHKFELKNRRTARESSTPGSLFDLYEEDASRLLFLPGHFIIHPFFSAFDPFEQIGPGVSYQDIFNLLCLTSFSLVLVPKTIT